MEIRRRVLVFWGDLEPTSVKINNYTRERKRQKVETAIELKLCRLRWIDELFENKGENVFENKWIFWDFENPIGTISQDKITVNNGRRCCQIVNLIIIDRMKWRWRERTKIQPPVRTEETNEHNSVMGTVPARNETRGMVKSWRRGECLEVSIVHVILNNKQHVRKKQNQSRVGHREKLKKERQIGGGVTE